MAEVKSLADEFKLMVAQALDWRLLSCSSYLTTSRSID
jgi:hypothetical protein